MRSWTRFATLAALIDSYASLAIERAETFSLARGYDALGADCRQLGDPDQLASGHA